LGKSYGDAAALQLAAGATGLVNSLALLEPAIVEVPE
jgi:hypothetical protein